jgi:hypothetical protein
MREYRLYWTWTSRLLTMGIPLFMIVAGVFMVVALSRSEQYPSGLAFVLVWTVIVVFVGLRFWRMPTEIRVSDNGRIRFKGWLRNFEVSAGEIESIKPGGNSIGYLVVNTRRGRITILNQFDGFHEFLTELKELNPNVKLRGC